MLRYILRKLAYGIVVLLLVVLTISSIIYLSPVDPATLTQGQRTDTKTVEAVQKQYGLDQALHVQLGRYLRDISPIDILNSNTFTNEKYSFIPLIPVGNEKYFSLKLPFLRKSYQTGERVSVMLSKAIPQTIVLAFSSILLACVIGVILGVVAALRKNTWLDSTAIVSSVMGYSLPSYVSAILLALVFGYYLQAWTGLNVQGSLFGIDDFGDDKIFWKNLILPAIALGIRPIGIITQLTRSSMLDVLSQDYIRTAKAKGLPKAKVIFKHGLRNALNPVVTAVSGWFAALLAGAFFVENVFSYNGLGKITVDALLTRDIPVVLGAILFTAFLFVIINLMVDILYTFLDPRVKLS